VFIAVAPLGTREKPLYPVCCRCGRERRRVIEKPFSRRDIASEINFPAPQYSCCTTRELFILRSALSSKGEITALTSRKKIALTLQNKTKKITPRVTCFFWEARGA
jgi:hypothetical protein